MNISYSPILLPLMRRRQRESSKRLGNSHSDMLGDQFGLIVEQIASLSEFLPEISTIFIAEWSPLKRMLFSYTRIALTYSSGPAFWRSFAILRTFASDENDCAPCNDVLTGLLPAPSIASV